MLFNALFSAESFKSFRAVPKLFVISVLMAALSACGGGGGSNPPATDISPVTLQDSDNVLADSGISTLDELTQQVSSKGALAFSVELTQKNPQLQPEAVVRLLKQNDRNIEYQKVRQQGIDAAIVDRLKQLPLSPRVVKSMLALPDPKLFPQTISDQALNRYNQLKREAFNRKLKLRGLAGLDASQFDQLQQAFAKVEIKNNFGMLDRAFQNVLVADTSAARPGQAAKNGEPVLANPEVISPQPVLDSGLPVADMCEMAALTLPMPVATVGASVNSTLVSSDGGNAVVKLPQSGIAVLKIHSDSAVSVVLTDSDGSTLVDQNVTGTDYLYLPVTRDNDCQALAFQAADSAYDITLIDMITPQRLSQHVLYNGKDYLSNAQKVALLGDRPFFQAQSYTFASFNSSLSDVATLFEMALDASAAGNNAFDVLIHSPSGKQYAATLAGVNGYQASGFAPAIARESGIWRIDILPPASVTVSNQQLAALKPVAASADGHSLRVMTLVEDDSEKVQTREFVLGVAKNISLKTQGDNGVDNEGEVSITLNTTMAPRFNVPDYIDDLLNNGDKMNDTVALWQCWIKSDQTGHEFEQGERCYEYRDEYQRRFDLYVYQKNNRYDPYNNPEYYQCAQGQEADITINGQDYCIRGMHAPWGMDNPAETTKTIIVMRDFDQYMRHEYTDANYLHILSNYYDLYQNWQTRSVLVDTAKFPYDGLAYKTRESLHCELDDTACLTANPLAASYQTPVVIETDRPIFGAPVDRVTETTLPISFDYSAVDQDEYDTDAELLSVLSYAATQVVNLASGNFVGLVCNSLALVDDLHQLERDAEDDPLGSASATINRYSASDPFYGLHNARNYSFFMSGLPEQNDDIDTYGQRLNYAQIACAATQLSISGINFARNADYLLGLDSSQLFDNATLETTIREAAALAGSVDMATRASEIAGLIRDGKLDEAQQLLKINQDISNLKQGIDVYADLDSLRDTFSNSGSAKNGNNVLKTNAHYLLGRGKKTRAEVAFERVSSLPLRQVTVTLDQVKIISNAEPDDDPTGAEIQLLPFVGLIDDRPRDGVDSRALFSVTDDSSDGPWNHLWYTHVSDGDVLSPNETIFSANGGYNAAALYIELAVTEDDGNSVEDDDMIGVFSRTIKFEEIFNQNAEFSWRHVSGDDYQLVISEYPIYNSKHQLSVENPLDPQVESQRRHNRNRHPSALVSLTINITLGDLSTPYPQVDTSLDVTEVAGGKDTLSMEMNEVNALAIGNIPAGAPVTLDDANDGKVLVYQDNSRINGTLYSYDVESYEMKKLFSWNVDHFTGDLMPIKQAYTAQKNIGPRVNPLLSAEVKDLSLVKLLPGNRLLFVFSGDNGAKILLVGYTDQGAMTLQSSIDIVDELGNPVYTLMQAKLSADRSGLLIPYLDANYRSGDRTQPPHPSVLYYQINGATVEYKSTLVGSSADTIVDVSFIDENNIAVLTNKLLYITDDSTAADWINLDFQHSCESSQLNCRFEIVDRNVMTYHINADHQNQMDLIDSFSHYVAPHEYNNGELVVNSFGRLSHLLFNTFDKANIHTLSATAQSAVLRAGYDLYELWHDPNIDAFVKTAESRLSPINPLRYNPLGQYYCATGTGKLVCSGHLQSANSPQNGASDTYFSGQDLYYFQFADFARDLVVGLTNGNQGLQLSLFTLYGGAAYKGPQISGDIFDTTVTMDGGDDVPGMAFNFRVEDRDTRIDQLTIEVTAQDNPFDEVIKTPFKTHNPLYTASCVTIEAGVQSNCSGTIIPDYENASFKQTVTVTVSDGIYSSHKSFTLFLDREAPALSDMIQTVSLASPEAYRPVNLIFDSQTSASAANCSGVNYCYLVNDGFVDEWATSNLPAWLTCSEQTSSAFGSQQLRCAGTPPMGAAGSYQIPISAFQNKGTTYEKSASMTLTLNVLAPDTTPEAFSFTTRNDVTRDSLIESNVVTLQGLTGYATLSLDKGEYRRNGGAWISAPASASDIVNGDSIQLRLRSSADYSTTLSATLTVGGVNGVFSVTTEADPAANDSTPDAFSFSALVDQPRATQVQSNAVTISGMTIAADISVANGEYKVDSGNWRSDASQISNGQSVMVRHTTSSNYASDTVTTLSIGGVSAQFRSTTLALLAPDLSSSGPAPSAVINSVFDFTPTNSGGEAASWSITNKPAWASFDSATGRLSGTVNSTDSFTINITATNAAGSDTFSATVSVQPDQAPTINGLTTNCSIDDDVCDFTFGDNANWRSAVTQVTIGESYGGATTTLSSPDDYELSAGQLRLKINASNNMVKQGGNWQVVISATGYSDTTTDLMLGNGAPTVGTLSVSPAFAVGQVSTVSAAVTNRLGVAYSNASVDAQLLIKNLTHDIDEVYKTADNIDSVWSELTTKSIPTDASGNLSLLLKLPGCISAEDGFQLTIGAQTIEYLNTAGGCIDVDWAVRKQPVFTNFDDTDVVIDSQGASYVLYSSTEDFEGIAHLGSSYPNDLYLVKFDRNGEQQWVRAIATQYTEYGVSMQLLNDEIYIAGSTTGDIDGDTGAQVKLGQYDQFVVKYDTSGNRLWSRQFGTANFDSVIQMSVYNNLIYLLSKVDYNTGDVTVPSNTIMQTMDLNGDNLQTLMSDTTQGGANDLIWSITSAPQAMKFDASGKLYLLMDKQVLKYDATGRFIESSITFTDTPQDMILSNDSVCLAFDYFDSSGDGLTHAKITCLNNVDLYERWTRVINSDAPYAHKSNGHARLAAQAGVIYALVSSEAEIYYDSSLAETPNQTLNLIALNENDGNVLNHRSWPTETRSDATVQGQHLSIGAAGNLYAEANVVHRLADTFQIGYTQGSGTVYYPQNSIMLKTSLLAGGTPIVTTGMTRSNGLSIVSDHDHSLQWMDDYSSIDNSGDWSSANNYCSTLSAGNVSGWRLPTDTELGLPAPYTPQEGTIFQHINTVDANVYYWASTGAGAGSHVAVMPQGPLGDGFADTDMSVHYRCVRDL